MKRCLDFSAFAKTRCIILILCMSTQTRRMMTDEDAEYDRMDAWEDEALARLRDADAWSEEETDEEDSLECLDGHFVM